MPCCGNGRRSGTQAAPARRTWGGAHRGLLSSYRAGPGHGGGSDRGGPSPRGVVEGRTDSTVGTFEEELPTRDALVAMGLPIKDDYDPEAHRSYEMVDDDDRDAQ